MAASARRIVITGLGVVCPLGQSPADFYAALLAGLSGVRVIRSVDPTRLPSKIAGEIPEFDAKKHLEKKHWKGLRTMARPIQLGVAASARAMEDAAVAPTALDPSRFGVEFGSGLIATDLEDMAEASKHTIEAHPESVSEAVWGGSGLALIPPLWMLKYLPNMSACHSSITYNAQGPNNSITESEVASLLALGEATRILQRDAADFFLVGGAESKLNPLSLARHALFLPLSRRNDDPEKASRPFDRNRDGTVIGEGAAVLALEELSHAQKRGAKIYAEMVGFGASFDRRRDGAGLARAIKAALADARITPDQLDHVNVHGNSTIEGDLIEAKGLHAFFGSQMPPIFAVKGSIGNLGSANGTVELVASIMAMLKGQLPASRNFETPDPACGIVVNTVNRPVSKPYFLKIGFTDLGQCGAAVIRRWDN